MLDGGIRLGDAADKYLGRIAFETWNMILTVESTVRMYDSLQYNLETSDREVESIQYLMALERKGLIRLELPRAITMYVCCDTGFALSTSHASCSFGYGWMRYPQRHHRLHHHQGLA